MWGANFAVRRAAVEQVGPFDESITRPHGDEEEWLERLRRAGGRVVYLAGAGLDHRRTADDARLRPLAQSRLRARPRRPRERRPARAGPIGGARAARAGGLRLAHAQARCPQGMIMGAHSAGRVVEALRSR